MASTKDSEPSEKDSEDRYLPALARAMVYHPNGNLQDLAKAIGVSKATLYRFCKTRVELVDRVVSYVGRCCIKAVRNDAVSDQLCMRMCSGCCKTRSGVFFNRR